ncbi:hypothetical protein AURANDRAFT_35560 [Aureococcus anophagefferens]|uniref:MYND-type domain-containing protein n=1 Tax=Aureococcus anophagefferens TaxID=44056 RepID=F0YS33_AURAN|nr:hypothetical protein AURANDRAFT_35560 [Aureococcus anophagefferens]EGB02077.1 hypothetical protein AURANDRAFT_35560 [Aureococcus anophagefferens]|eukprot:XP_009043225.1 hypothetical protein AURANDRAFT_35560 [Aureococcus anophagefferens]
MRLCLSCNSKVKEKSCPLCQAPAVLSWKDELAWIRRHVENDVPEQVARLGEVYSEGALGVVKSDKKAAKIFKRGVELGSVNAMVNLSCMYLYGNGVKPDKKKAMQLGRMAADRGSADAQRNIGHQLIIEGNFEEGFPYLRRAAEQGHTQAEVTLGVFCATREFEIDKDTMKRYGLSDEEAKHWLLRAAAKGNEEAKAHLAELDA